MSDILNRLTVVFHNVFQDDEILLTRDSTAADVDGWDSLMHVNLIINIEKTFGIRFTSSEVANLKDVGQLVDLIGVRTISKR